MVNLYFIGTAGSGKTSLTYAFTGWMEQTGFNAITVNLDPGMERPPYVPDVDIRDMIRLDEIMEEYEVGPNGAQIIAADLLALRAEEIKDEIDGYQTDYVLIDTPGQMELFILRESGRFIIDALNPRESLIVFLYDAALSKKATGILSLMMQAASTQFRFNLPFINVLSKADILPDAEIKKILEWSGNPVKLHGSLSDERATMYTQLNLEFFRALANFGVYSTLIPVSSRALFGMEDIYNTAQQLYFGGEDLSKD